GWRGAEKGGVVAASLERGSGVSAVAREAEIHPSQLYGWRRQLCARPQAAADFAAVRITAGPAPSAMPAAGTLRGIALGRKSWLFAGSDRGGERAAGVDTLIQTARLNDVDPQAWLVNVFGCINDHAIHRLDQLLPWNWKTHPARLAA